MKSGTMRWLGWLAGAFWAAVAVWVAVWVVAPNCRQKVTLDFADATGLTHVGGQCYAAYFDRRLPRDACVMEDVRELPLDTTADDSIPGRIAALGDGLSHVDRAAQVVYWSSCDGTDPLSNGRHYRLVGVRRWRPDLLTRIITAVLPLLLALVLTLWRRRQPMAEFTGWRRVLIEAIGLSGKSPRWLRWGLAVAVLVALLPLVTSTWNRYAIDTDTWDYTHGTFNRTPFTYFFLKTFDRHCDDPVPIQEPRVAWGVFHDGHSHYLRAVRAWKVLWLLAVAVLVLAVSRFINVWLLAGALCWLTEAILPGSYFDPAYWLDHVLSEPLCYCVEILFLAAVAQYLCRRQLVWGIVLGGLLAAAVLVRPSNLVFAAVLPVAWLVHWRHDGWRWATLRAALLAAPLVAATLAVCQYNKQQHGHFKTYAFKGYYLIAVGFQTATDDDINAFGDPQMREFVRLCLTEYKNQRHGEWSLEAADANTFGIAVPAFCRVYMETLPIEQRPDLHNYYHQSEETFATVATTLLRRHPGAYAKIVGANFGVVWQQNPRTHTATLLALGLALLLYARTRRWTWLYLAFFSALPLLTMLPCVLTLYPLERYTSQLFFAQAVCLPLTMALALMHGLSGLRHVQGNAPLQAAAPLHVRAA